MEAQVTWHDGLSFTGTADSGFTVKLGGSVDVGGADDGFRPLELMLISLIGCTGMDVISILQKKRQSVTSFVVNGQAIRAEDHPRSFTKATIEYHVTGHAIDEKAILRSLELSAARYCPAQAMLGQIIPIELKYHIYEEEAEGEKRLIKSGSHTHVPGTEE
jgi:putative redox protein